MAVDGGGLAGIVTEQDVLRRLKGAEQPVEAIMTAPVLTVRADDQLYRAIGFMRRHRLRHMPVVDGQGAVVGMLELHEALAVAAGPLGPVCKACTAITDGAGSGRRVVSRRPRVGVT